jgi:hypothetical protein
VPAERRTPTANGERQTKFGCKGEGFVYRCDHMAKSFYDLSEKDILALAISLEEEDGRIYGNSPRECGPPIQRLPIRSTLCAKRNQVIVII